MKIRESGRCHVALSLLLALGVASAATKVFSQEKLEYRAVGTFMEGCSCSVACPCALTGSFQHGCQGVTALVLTAGNYKGVNLAGAKMAWAGLVGQWSHIYVDASDPQREAATAFAKAMFALLGKIEAVKNASINLSGKGGRYTLSIDGGKTVQITTEPVLGGDKENPITHTNTLIPFSPTAKQARTIKGSFHDGDRSFTLEGSNSYFNDQMETSGKI